MGVSGYGHLWPNFRTGAQKRRRRSRRPPGEIPRLLDAPRSSDPRVQYVDFLGPFLIALALIPSQHTDQNKLDDVVTLIIQEIENNAFPQELVQVRLEGYPIKHAVVRDSKQSGKITLFAVFISDLNLVMDLPLEFLMRDKKSLAKNLVKKLVRAFAFQDSIWPGSPWVVNVCGSLLFDVTLLISFLF